MFFTLAVHRNENLIGVLIQRWRTWRESRASLAGLDRCGTSEIARMAHDLSLTTNELRALARKGPDSARLLYRRMADLGIDRDSIAKSDPRLMRDMQKNCALCESKGRCRHDLARGADRCVWASYCPSDPLLNELMSSHREREVVAIKPDDQRRMQAGLLALLMIGLAWVVLLASDQPFPLRQSTPIVALTQEPAPPSAVTCLDSSCLNLQQRWALEELRIVQQQGWLASSAEALASVGQASLIAQEVHAGQALVCLRQGGTTYYGLMFQDGCSAGGREASSVDGYARCRPMAGGGACLLR
jgi:hypothetical protein